MSKHLIVGAGPVGTATAARLVATGHEVTAVTRSGGGPEVAGVRRVALDAGDATALAQLAEGCVAIYNCANPSYHRWVTDWPPIATALLEAAKSSGAVLATVSNLYGYGPVDGPMTEELPLRATTTKGRVRAEMWRQALAAHDAGQAAVVEVRGSDYFGPTLTSQSALGERVCPRILEGKSVSVLGNPDVAHTFTYVPDVAELLVRAAADPTSWGRAWHVPSAPPCTQREAVAALAAAASVPAPSVRALPHLVLKTVGLFSPQVRELEEVRYQFTAPFVMDSSAATAHFSCAPTPFPEACATTIAWWRSEAAQRAA